MDNRNDEEDEQVQSINDATTTTHTINQDPMMRALGNHLVLDNIFDHLTKHDVKNNCALVNKFWNQSASKHCSKWTLFKILFHCFRDQKHGQVCYKIVVEEGKGGYSEFGGRRSKFFSSTVTLTLEELEEKLQKTGRKKRIWLTVEIKLYACKKLRDTVSPIPHDHTVYVKATRLLVSVLPWLTHLTINDDHWKPFPAEDVTHFHSLLEDAPKLEHSSIRPERDTAIDNRPQLTRGRLFQTLHLNPQASQNCYFNYPALPSLTTIVLNYPKKMMSELKNDFSYVCFIPPEFNVRRNLPNVTRIEVIGFIKAYSPSQLNALLPSGNCGNIWQSVRHLKICQSEGSSMIIQRLAEILPGILTLEVDNSPDWLQDCLPSIWKFWPKLEELFMIVESKFRGVKSLDEAITGIPKKRCAWLKKQSDKLDIKLDQYKIAPAVSDMKNLRKFSVTFIGSYTTVKPGNHLMSQVSAFYGFHLIPDLEVNLRIRSPCRQSKRISIGNMLEPILPFVHFDPNYIPPFNF